MTAVSRTTPGSTALQHSSGRFFGRFLVDNAVITNAELSSALSGLWQTNRSVGELAVDAGLLSAAQANHVNMLQSQLDSRWGDIAVSLGLLERPQVVALLDSQAEVNLHLGEVLVKLGLLTSSQLRDCLVSFESQEVARRASVMVPSSLTDCPFVTPAVDFAPRLLRRVARVIVKVDPPVAATRTSAPMQASIRLTARADLVITLFAERPLAEAITRGMWSNAQASVIGEARLEEAGEEFMMLLGRYAKACNEINGHETTLAQLPSFLHTPADIEFPLCSPAGRGALVFHR